MEHQWNIRKVRAASSGGRLRVNGAIRGAASQ